METIIWILSVMLIMGTIWLYRLHRDNKEILSSFDFNHNYTNDWHSAELPQKAKTQLQLNKNQKIQAWAIIIAGLIMCLVFR